MVGTRLNYKVSRCIEVNKTGSGCCRCELLRAPKRLKFDLALIIGNCGSKAVISVQHETISRIISIDVQTCLFETLDEPCQLRRI